MNRRAIEGVLVQAAIDLLPPDVQRALLDDKAFIGRWRIATTTSLALGKDGPSFNRSQLYQSIRSAIRDLGSVISVDDQNGRTWQLLAEPRDEGVAFSLRTKEKHYSLMDHSALADDVSVRTGWFERMVPAIFLDRESTQSWLNRLRQSPLSDDEFAELIADIELTPANVFRALRANMEQVNVDVTTLVPHDRRYYEHLVGRLGQSATVAEYVEAGAKPRIANLQGGESRQGFSFALLMCSAGAIAECVQIDAFDRHELVQIYEWLVEHGDPISRVGAVEIALSHLDVFPELGPLVERIVEGLLLDDPEDDGSSFALLCATVVMAASELARKRTLGDAPPFYLRQAAIAHASLVIRAINEARINIASVTRWAQAMGIGQIYFLQGLIDLRREPRWLPDFVGADQLRFEFIGRITNAAGRNEGKIKLDSLRKLLLGPDSKLAQAAQWPFPHLPGPMEGAVASGRPYPDDLLRAVRTALEADRLEASAFAGLVNGALLFDMQEGMADLAAGALRRVRFSLEDTDDKGKNFSLVGGLATLAAVTRSGDLADALRVLTRVMRRRKRLSGDLDEELRIALITAASFEDLEEWARFAGEWLTEIAFETSDKNAARAFLPKLRRLVKMEPMLARHCASADAALDAFAH
ncbi:hypothetical protein [Roseateles violae]|uniref:GreAB-C-like domain-containing protein n=1 Tax=Roseateles violae TaxID=3058042 RepID=A0ABT8DYE1_9BURK|nr:hypothetical protein [Pelomonas sp. PFR6]MDN3922514.1 hypothetical protein [Pelomonas sp. PFR6]